ncbi:ScbR family autoregulator-binding transcription factor [Streptomyces sp. NPDC091416]|uniref:ScbR family autoregulator-binding transcription factor n=1 Tax=Streptomyces sp. NPDC091416 TaxID=3366003 RepID=UPI0037FFFF09
MRTEEVILQAASELFDTKGFTGTSLADIMAASGGITKGALYHHFESKADIARIILERQVTMSTVNLPAQTTRLQEAIDTSFAFAHLLQNDAVARAGTRLSIIDRGLPDGLARGEAIRAWLDHAELLLMQAHEAGHMVPTVKPREAAETIVGQFIGIQLTSEILHGREDLPRGISLMWRMILPGIALPAIIAGLEYGENRINDLKLSETTSQSGS